MTNITVSGSVISSKNNFNFNTYSYPQTAQAHRELNC